MSSIKQLIINAVIKVSGESEVKKVAGAIAHRHHDTHKRISLGHGSTRSRRDPLQVAE
jgi:hypothetical protein